LTNNLVSFEGFNAIQYDSIYNSHYTSGYFSGHPIYSGEKLRGVINTWRMNRTGQALWCYR